MAELTGLDGLITLGELFVAVTTPVVPSGGGAPALLHDASSSPVAAVATTAMIRDTPDTGTRDLAVIAARACPRAMVDAVKG